MCSIEFEFLEGFFSRVAQRLQMYVPNNFKYAILFFFVFSRKLVEPSFEKVNSILFYFNDFIFIFKVYKLRLFLI